MIKQFYFKQFNLALVICLHFGLMSNSSIWPIDRTLSGATTPGQSWPGSNGNEGVLRIPQSSNITGALPWLLNVIFRILVVGGGVLPLPRGAVGLFYSPSQLGCFLVNYLNNFSTFQTFNLIVIHSQINKSNLKIHNVTYILVFKTTYMRKESVIYRFKILNGKGGFGGHWGDHEYLVASLWVWVASHRCINLCFKKLIEINMDDKIADSLISHRLIKEKLKK